MSEKRKDDKGRILKTGESQRKDKTYMYRYTDAFHQRQTIYAPTLQELREKEKDIVVRNALAPCQAPKKVTVADIVEKYCYLKRGSKRGTRESYALMQKLISKYPIAKMRITDVKMSDAKLWLVDLYQEGRAVSSVYTLGKFMRSAFSMAIEDDLLYKNPFAFRMDFLPEKPNTRKALTKNEQIALIDFLSTTYRYRYYRDYIVVLLGTGLRICEFLGLTVKDVDFKNRRIEVCRQLRISQSNELYIDQPKSRSGYRFIPMTDEVYDALQRMVLRAKSNKIDWIIDGCSGFIVFDTRGKINSSVKFEQMVRSIVKKYNETHEQKLPSITPHVLRHTFCTNMANQGMPPTSLQYLMGHAQVSTTMNVYTHTSYEQAERAMFAVIQQQEIAQKSYDEVTPIFTPIAR